MPDTALSSTWIGTVTLRWLQDPEAKPVLIHKGGTRSGKTYNACIAWAVYLSRLDEPERLSMVRATLPALKATAWHDMKEVLQHLDMYSEDRHNKSDKVFTFANGSVIDYFPTDDEMKVHGRKRDHLWANEANELTLAKWDQLNLRTRKRVMLDFNPSMVSDHWIWQRYEGNPNALWYTSTYRDNPYISAEQLRKIEDLKEQDPWMWKVYGEGEKGRPATSIYRDVVGLSEWTHEQSVLGLDFGYNDPMALARVARSDREGKPHLDVWALLHASHLTTADLIERLPDLGVDTRERIVCDSAEPDRIQMLRNAGYNAVPADKGQGSVTAGIDAMKTHRIRIGGPAAEAAKREFEGYRYKTHAASGEVLDEPVKSADHTPDAVRYAAMKDLLLPARRDTRIIGI